MPALPFNRTHRFVGESEENVRKLFADAEAEQAQRGDNSQLHIIIFDEIDAICKQRGTSSGGTGTADSVVNQLLSKIDGGFPAHHMPPHLFSQSRLFSQ